jgi:nitrite reductase/ring-hydroxylating ferredoxin subunit
MDEDSRIVAAEDVPEDGTLLVTLRDGDDEREAILTRLSDDTVVGFENYCQHWTDVRLDRGSGAPVRNGELVCTKHGATFERDSGYCDFGPCEGAYLQTVDVTVDDGAVYLTDDDYEFARVGEAETDDLDRSTSPGDRLGF